MRIVPGGGSPVTRPEQKIHFTVVQHLRQRGVQDLVYLHPANGGLRSKTEGAIFQGLGVRRSASDLLLWHQGKSFALELKAPGGRATKSQLAVFGRHGKGRCLHLSGYWPRCGPAEVGGLGFIARSDDVIRYTQT